MKNNRKSPGFDESNGGSQIRAKKVFYDPSTPKSQHRMLDNQYAYNPKENWGDGIK